MSSEDTIYVAIDEWCDQNSSYIRPTFRTFNDYTMHPEYAGGIGQMNWASCKKAISEQLNNPGEIDDDKYETYFNDIISGLGANDYILEVEVMDDIDINGVLKMIEGYLKYLDVKFESKIEDGKILLLISHDGDDKSMSDPAILEDNLENFLVIEKDLEVGVYVQ